MSWRPREAYDCGLALLTARRRWVSAAYAKGLLVIAFFWQVYAQSPRQVIANYG